MAHLHPTWEEQNRLSRQIGKHERQAGSPWGITVSASLPALAHLGWAHMMPSTSSSSLPSLLAARTVSFPMGSQVVLLEPHFHTSLSIGAHDNLPFNEMLSR